MPTVAASGRRSWRKTRLKIAIQTGIIAMRSAAIPDGTVCSPQATAPIPPPMSIAPTMNESRSSTSEGRTSARRRTIATAPIMIRPASRNRVDAMRNGGIDSIAIRIPR